MHIQRIKTLHETPGLGVADEMSSQVITKDYFESNPVFYSCYRIFPFERGHGIFVANSIRRFLLYEIPTIAITSVLIHPIKKVEILSQSSSVSPEMHGLHPATGFDLGNGKTHFSSSSPESMSETGEPAILDQQSLKLASSSPPDQSGVNPKKGTRSVTKPTAEKASARTQLKKKKVTKKALKEQAAELFSYGPESFADIQNFHQNSETQEVSALTEFTTIPFVRESFLEILLNLKACVFENTFAFDEPPGERSSKVLKGKLILNASQESIDDPRQSSEELFFQTDFTESNSTRESSLMLTHSTALSSKGRKVREYKIFAKDLILPPGLVVRNPDLVLATLVAPETNCELELSFEKIFQPDLTTLSMKTGRVPHRAEQKRRNVPLDGTLFPIKKVNFALSYTKFQKELITFEIWTNGALNPRDAIFQSVEKILGVFQTLRQDQVKEIDSFAETALDEFEPDPTSLTSEETREELT